MKDPLLLAKVNGLLAQLDPNLLTEFDLDPALVVRYYGAFDYDALIDNIKFLRTELSDRVISNRNPALLARMRGYLTLYNRARDMHDGFTYEAVGTYGPEEESLLKSYLLDLSSTLSEKEATKAYHYTNGIHQAFVAGVGFDISRDIPGTNSSWQANPFFLCLHALFTTVNHVFSPTAQVLLGIEKGEYREMLDELFAWGGDLIDLLAYRRVIEPAA